jgi:hypothetical protein
MDVRRLPNTWRRPRPNSGMLSESIVAVTVTVTVTVYLLGIMAVLGIGEQKGQQDTRQAQASKFCRGNHCRRVARQEQHQRGSENKASATMLSSAARVSHFKCVCARAAGLLRLLVQFWMVFTEHNPVTSLKSSPKEK